MLTDFFAGELSHFKAIAPFILKRLAAFAAAYIIAHYGPRLSGYGIALNQVELTAAIYSLIEFVAQRITRGAALSALALGLLFLPSRSRAAWTGRLDLSPDFSAVMARDYTDGFWMAGTEKPLWSLSNNGSEVFYLAPQYLHGIEGGNQAAAIAIGLPISDGARLLMGATGKLFSSSGIVLPGWTQVAAQALDIELSEGYNFIPQYSYIKPWFATFAFVIRVPLGSGAKL